MAIIKIDIFDSSRMDGPGVPGEIVKIAVEGITVAAAGGRILIKRLRAVGGHKIAAGDYAKAAGILLGDTFDKPKPKAQA